MEYEKINEYDKRIDKLKSKKNAFEMKHRFVASEKQEKEKGNIEKIIDEEDEEEMLLEDVKVDDKVDERESDEEEDEKYKPVKVTKTICMTWRAIII